MFSNRLTRLIGAIDAAVFFSFWLAVGALVSDEPRQVLVVLNILIFPTLLVAWRGRIDARLALAGSGALRRTVRDGFLWGSLCVPIMWAWTFVPLVAHAAGSPLDDVSLSDPVSWLIILVPLIVSMMVCGGVGSLHGLVLFELNRWLAKMLAPGNSSAAAP